MSIFKIVLPFLGGISSLGIPIAVRWITPTIWPDYSEYSTKEFDIEYILFDKNGNMKCGYGDWKNQKIATSCSRKWMKRIKEMNKKRDRNMELWLKEKRDSKSIPKRTYGWNQEDSKAHNFLGQKWKEVVKNNKELQRSCTSMNRYDNGQHFVEWYCRK